MKLYAPQATFEKISWAKFMKNFYQKIAFLAALTPTQNLKEKLKNFRVGQPKLDVYHLLHIVYNFSVHCPCVYFQF